MLLPSAPDFQARNQHGADVRLADLLRRSRVLLVFFPYAFSGGCSRELKALAEAYAEIVAHGVTALGISCDAMFSQRVFAETERLPFALLTDFWPHGQIARSYGVFDEELGCALRGSFLITSDGRIAWSVRNPIGTERDIGEHVAQVRALASSARG